MAVVKNALRSKRTQSIEREEHQMNNTVTKKALLSSVIYLATAGVLVGSQGVLAGGGSDSYEGAGNVETHGHMGVDPESNEMDQEMSGAQGMDDTGQTEIFDQESRITGTQDRTNPQGQSLRDLPQETIQGRKVVNLNGEELGSVEEVVTDADGSISGIVLSVGGALGVGEADVFASTDEIQVTEDQLVWQTSLDEEALAQSDEYRAAAVMNQSP